MIDNQKNLNFEYTPIETEFLNNSDNNIYSPKKDRLISQENQQSFSIDEDNYDNLEYEKEIAAIEKKTKNNILFQINTLESLRISKDDSTTLYEQINGKKEEEKFETPNKKNLKNNYNFKINENFCKKFSYENKNKNNNNNNNKFNIEKELNIDFKKELEKNLKEIFEKKGKLYKLKFNHFNNNNNNTIKNKNNNNNSKKKLNEIQHQITNYNNYNNNTIQKKTLNNSNYKEKISNSSSKISCNTTIKKNNKTKCIYQIKKNNIPIQKKPNKRKLSKEKNISNSMTNTTNSSTNRKNNDKINLNNINIKEFSPKPPIKNKKFIPHSGIKIQKPIAYFSHNYSYRNVYRAQTELNNNNNKENINNSNNFYYNNNNNLTSRISKKSNSLKEKRKISLKKNESNLSINFEKKNKKINNKISKKNINLSTSKHENKYKLFTKDILLSNKNKNNNNNNKLEFYKNNIKNITIAPISSITSKLFIRNNINNKNLSYKNIENSFNNYKNKLNYYIKTDRFGKKKMNIINNNKNNSTKNSFHTITYN